MPTYDYQCDACGHQFEAFQSMRDDALSVCPSCNKAALRRLITGGTGVIFKGSGFYVNDSRKNSGSSTGTRTAPASTTAPSTESGGDSSTSSGTGASESSSKESGTGDSGGKTSSTTEKQTA